MVYGQLAIFLVLPPCRNFLRMKGATFLPMTIMLVMPLQTTADLSARLERHRDRDHIDEANGTDSRDINLLKTPVGMSP